ncbi:Bifunctional protein GlmU [Koleobacter methoxysyntrophicus]|jgi:molybdopterin-guanine dinucleotide biosynthesis protein A|uniref:Bifunctional protein GlmU n=1 Tax=Koleobacter methoxysyntrophicus TaxID=2751313 RepID=A0A8A0RJM5_9FIRM|nr:nucleotidyltransferase family protein [Koleobacter methoxysyntrophicus]NPV44783.1 NTP transferase domain-containing protein [Bacillota bacterium]QSQ08525.1 Bifunctional protein GlmU [Koleobacter methoxysyntrophicus]
MVNAIILAGDQGKGKLRNYSPNKALLNINGKYMVEYIVDAVNMVEEINRAVIVGPGSQLAPLVRGKVEKIIPCTDSIIRNALLGVEYLRDDSRVLILSCDIPMITPEAVEDFLIKTKHAEADLYYPIITKEANEKKYPGVKRTYVKLKEGVFTGGNIFLVNPGIIKKTLHKAEAILANRKKPFKLAVILGWDFVIKLLLGKLVIPELEKRVSELLGIKAVAVVSDYAEIGTDVDKPSDFILAQKVLTQTVKINQ